MSTASWSAVATSRSRCTRAANSSSCWRKPARDRPKRTPALSGERAALALRALALRVRVARDRGGLHLQGSHRGQAPAAGVEHPLKLIAHRAEQVRGALGVIRRGVCRRGVPLEACRERRAHQYCLAEGDAAQGGGIEAREGME